MKTQNQKISEYLKKGNSLTPMDALKKFGCFRLASRINDLRSDGLEIVTKRVTKKGKNYASYSLC